MNSKKNIPSDASRRVSCLLLSPVFTLLLLPFHCHFDVKLGWWSLDA